MRHLLLLVLLLISTPLFSADDVNCSTSAYFQDSTEHTSTVAFKKRCLPNKFQELKEHLNIRGGIYQIGNQVICAMDNGVSTSECINPELKIHTDGSCGDNSFTNDGCQNNDFRNGPDSAYLGFADYDDNTSNSSDYNFTASESTSTTSSTMARLSLEDGQTVLWARLYWMGDIGSDPAYDEDNISQVLFRTPTSNGYDTVTCSAYAEARDTYSCSADVTSQVTQSGEYWVANVKGNPLNSNMFAAWNLVIVYSDPRGTYQNINIYEGFSDFYNASFSVNIDGFLTPEQGDFNSSLYLFSGESDNGYDDSITLTDTNNNEHTVYNLNNNSLTDLLNASISNNGVNNTDRLPSFTNALGIDIDTLFAQSDVNGTQIIENNQTSTTLKFTSDGDRLYTPVIGFSTQLYVPDICYDYGYSQDNRSFTAETNSSIDPAIKGLVTINNPIKLNIYIRNREDGSDIQNVTFHLSDLNTTQMNITGDVKKTSSGGLTYSDIPSGDIVHTTSNLSFELDTTIQSLEGVFTEITLNPLQSTLDVPLDMSVEFDLFTSSGEVINYSDFLLNKDVPLCTPAGLYTPKHGIYSVIDRNINGSITENRTDLKYNLFTQVANRPIQAKIVAFDPIDTDKVVKSNDFMAIEMFDAKSFYDTEISCQNPNKISVREWFHFGSNTNRVTDANLSLSSSFYNVAREDSGFRIWYFRDKSTGRSLFKTNISDTTKVDLDYNLTSTPICDYPHDYDGTITDFEGACGDGTGLDLVQQKSCAACLFGHTAIPICSRDNFSIRPESFSVKIYDIDHTKVLNSLDRNNSASPINNKTVHLAAGYNYRFDINATSHISNNPIVGYTAKSIDADFNASFNWSPDPLKVISGCNDTSAKGLSIALNDGAFIDAIYAKERNASNVGQYNLNITDTKWTQADSNPRHHFDVNGGRLIHFDLSGLNRDHDCLLNSNTVPSITTNLNNTNIGCSISSSHTNEDNSSLSTDDYNITFVPYAIDMSTFNASSGKGFIPPLASNPMVYMSNLDTTSNMGVHYIGSLRAVGEDNNSLSNFVDKCYAEDLSIQLDHNASVATTLLPQFQVAYNDANNSTGAVDVNVLSSFVQNIPSHYFVKAQQGVLPMQLHFNFERNVSLPKEIITVHFGDLNSSCTTGANCQSHAKLLNNYEATGSIQEDANITIDSNVTFAYGRAHAPRYRINGNTGTVNLFYEVFCKTSNCASYGLTQESIDDVYWYIHPAHSNQAIHGDIHSSAANISFVNVAFDNQGTKSVQTTYDEARNYPFKTKVLMSPDSWLVYNRYDENATTNNFVIEYYKSATSWSGKVNNSGTVDSNASKTTNRRINW